MSRLIAAAALALAPAAAVAQTLTPSPSYISAGTGASLALGGCTLGSDTLCLTGSASLSGTLKASGVAVGGVTPNSASFTVPSGGDFRTDTNNRVYMQTGVASGVVDIVASGTDKAAYFNQGHVQFNGTAPSLSSCGTSPSISGSDTAGEVTTGTGAPTSCVITFSTQFANNGPFCIVQDRTTGANLTAYAATTTSITLTTAAVSSQKVTYVCHGN